MDLNTQRRRVILKELPSASVVLDPSTVLKLAAGGLDKTRKRLRARLTSRERAKLTGDKAILEKEETALSAPERERPSLWARDFPDLITAYQIKERTRGLFSKARPEHTKELMQACLHELPPALVNDFERLANVLAIWEREITNWHRFDTPDSLSEPVQRLDRAVRRMGRGYSFDVIRARLLYRRHAQRAKPPSNAPKEGYPYTTGATEFFAGADGSTRWKKPAALPRITTISEELEADFPE